MDRILERLRNENPAQISLIVTSIPHEVTAGTIALEIFHRVGAFSHCSSGEGFIGRIQRCMYVFNVD